MPVDDQNDDDGTADDQYPKRRPDGMAREPVESQIKCVHGVLSAMGCRPLRLLLCQNPFLSSEPRGLARVAGERPLADR